MLAELVHHVIGVDPDRDWITLAAVDAHSSGVVAEGRLAATGDGYRDAAELVGLLGAEVAYWPCAAPGAESSRR